MSDIAPLIAHRPAPPVETAFGPAGREAPLVVLFADAAAAEGALRRAGARLLRHRSGGVVTVEPSPGLRERLYAAGALLVVS
ncbi:hypothetical protein [Roseomonas sp. KE0001]|uniref:hypothetical protein n=1 Tax=unclassified Roseomonas TaxID=2617492 RepID=UPI0018E04BF9|nr:hypothetical protein [Roseomonas sp. KE0001]MBI0434346.1 hypothetical protein [Roseomonas sp. KE0001]